MTVFVLTEHGRRADVVVGVFHSAAAAQATLDKLLDDPRTRSTFDIVEYCVLGDPPVTTTGGA